MLAVVKYTNFMIHNINTVMGWFGGSTTISFWDIYLMAFEGIDMASITHTWSRLTATAG